MWSAHAWRLVGGTVLCDSVWTGGGLLSESLETTRRLLKEVTGCRPVIPCCAAPPDLNGWIVWMSAFPTPCGRVVTVSSRCFGTGSPCSSTPSAFLQKATEIRIKKKTWTNLHSTIYTTTKIYRREYKIIQAVGRANTGGFYRRGVDHTPLSESLGEWPVDPRALVYARAGGGLVFS